jgi:hypothetical protein
MSKKNSNKHSSQKQRKEDFVNVKIEGRGRRISNQKKKVKIMVCFFYHICLN